MSRGRSSHILDEPIVGHLRRDCITLRADASVGDSLASLRARDVGQRPVYFYAVDESGKLVGVVPTRRLLVSPPEATVASIMVDRVAAIPHTATVLVACEFFLQYRFLAFPVVDDENRLLGVVDVDLFTTEMFDVAARHTREDVFQLLGVHLARRRERSTWRGFRNRFPWLLCNIGGGLACAVLAARYEVFLDSAIILALFIPVVLALSESVSMQSTTLTLQWLHQGRPAWAAVGQVLRQELATAALLGAGCGLVVALVIQGWKGKPVVAGAVGLSIALAMITSCLFGVLWPTVVRALRGDPRIAAGPIVLATADVATLYLYFRLSAWLLGE
ncbi:MAG: magnesium transporter [Planctomycetes bacterium]|nr:magnesium transporter [Planctomycetota bacterium]